MRQKLFIVTAALSLVGALAATGVHAGKLYKWVDANGKVSYQDKPPPEDNGKIERKELSQEKSAQPEGLDELAERVPVVLYAIPKCASCDMARNYLKTRGVPFADKDASSDTAAQAELRKRAGSLSVPTIVIGDKVITEYSQAWLESELNQAGYPQKAAAPATP